MLINSWLICQSLWMNRSGCPDTPWSKVHIPRRAHSVFKGFRILRFWVFTSKKDLKRNKNWTWLQKTWLPRQCGNFHAKNEKLKSKIVSVWWIKMDPTLSALTKLCKSWALSKSMLGTMALASYHNLTNHFSEFMLLKGKFDLGTKNQRDFSASVVSYK